MQQMTSNANDTSPPQRVQMKTLQLSSSITVSELENLLCELRSRETEIGYVLDLPNKFPNKFLLHSHMFAFLITFLKNKAEFSIRNHLHGWPKTALPDQYDNTLLGVLCCLFYDRITDLDNTPFPLTLAREALRKVIIRKQGLLERKMSDPELSVYGSSLTLCCVEPTNKHPWLIKDVIENLELFSERLTSLRYILERRSRIHSEQRAKAFSPNVHGPNERLMKFLFEIYQNSYEHGESGQDIRGLRFFQFRRHIGTRKDLLTATEDLPPLKQYIDDMTKARGEHRFIEISVSDSGPGLCRGYLNATHNADHSQWNRSKSLGLLFDLLLTPLTRKLGIQGAGYGLIDAIGAARDLHGFLTLRTDSFWIYASYTVDSRQYTDSELLQEFSDIEYPSEIQGTHFSLIVPSPL